MRQLLLKILRKLEYELDHKRQKIYAPENNFPSDFTKKEIDIIEKVLPFTMTNEERLIALIRAVEYISNYEINGAIVECGVWRGGSMMAVALKLEELNNIERELFLYDTFQGMTEPKEIDIQYDGKSAQELLGTNSGDTSIWAYASLESVVENMNSTGYPKGKIHYIKGKVEDTIPGILPKQIAILRLDSDWYESTKHVLEHLFPLLDSKGVLIIDDYGHWQGCKKAVNEYFENFPGKYYFHRVDYSCRLIMKISNLSSEN